MLYHGFYVKITSLENIQREQNDGNIVLCDGYQIEVFSDKSEEVPVDVFTAAVGFEILTDSITDAEQFVKDVIDSEEKEYLKMLEEYSNSNYGLFCSIFKRLKCQNCRNQSKCVDDFFYKNA